MFPPNSSNNTNKLSPQEHAMQKYGVLKSSNNTNKLSPQELLRLCAFIILRSNNTNKLSPQEPTLFLFFLSRVQIIQINLVLKNCIHELFPLSLFK